MYISKTKVGSDIEWFVKNEKTKRIVSAEGLIPGTKENPHILDPSNPYYACSVDNVMAEGNIPPCETHVQFVSCIFKVKRYIEELLPPDHILVAKASAKLSPKYLQTPNAKMFGCDPSYNCWTNDVIQPKCDKSSLRTAGFHIHIGYDEPSVEKNIKLAKIFDLQVGLLATIAEPEDEGRSLGYRVAGNFRHQPHGMEYRFLSSYFVKDVMSVMWCFDLAKKAIATLNFIEESKHLNLNWKVIDQYSGFVQLAINEKNKELAKKLVQVLQISDSAYRH